jgi:predicted transposase YbfD/YdcC
MDVMGRQIKIAKKIREKVADYLLALKGNQSSLEEKIKEKFFGISRPGPKTFVMDEFTSVDERC